MMQELYGYLFWFLLAVVIMIFDMLISDPNRSSKRPPREIPGKKVKK